MTQVELFGKAIIHPGSIIVYLEDSGVFIATVNMITVEDGKEFYLLNCKCGKCPQKKVYLINVLEVFDINDIFNNVPLINNQQTKYLH
jgi:hypothetical protein